MLLNIYSMIIKKFKDYNAINENITDTPESYIKRLLSKIERDIKKMFDYDDPQAGVEGEDPNKIEKIKTSGESMTFKDLSVKLESTDISKYSNLYDSLTVKFTDVDNTYALIIMVDVKEAIPDENDDEEKDFSPKDIEKCFIKFKKYDLNTLEVIGQLTKNVDPNKIDEEFLIDLKIELDEETGDEDDFEIETE